MEANQRVDHALSMKTLKWLLTHLLLISFATSLQGEQTAKALLAQASQMHAAGNPRAAISILEPVLRDPPEELSGAQLGVAWNMLGSAYQGVEDYPQARRCYETSMQILKSISNARDEYASAVSNMGSLQIAVGDLSSARSLAIKARNLYALENDHGGLSATANTLAMLDVAQKDLAGARKEINEAFHQSEKASGLGENDYAAMYIVKGSVLDEGGDPHGAIAAYEKAIELWSHHKELNGYIIGTGYALRGSAFDKLGDSSRATADLQFALSLFAQNYGQTSTAYLKTEIRYARVLRHAGMKQEAAQIEKDARSGITALSRQQCNGCTISAESFR